MSLNILYLYKNWFIFLRSNMVCLLYKKKKNKHIVKTMKGKKSQFQNKSRPCVQLNQP